MKNQIIVEDCRPEHAYVGDLEPGGFFMYKDCLYQKFDSRELRSVISSDCMVVNQSEGGIRTELHINSRVRPVKVKISVMENYS